MRLSCIARFAIPAGVIALTVGASRGAHAQASTNAEQQCWSCTVFIPPGGGEMIPGCAPNAGGHVTCNINCSGGMCGCGTGGSASCGGSLRIPALDGQGSTLAAAGPAASVRAVRGEAGQVLLDCQERIVGRSYSASFAAAGRSKSVQLLI